MNRERRYRGASKNRHCAILAVLFALGPSGCGVERLVPATGIVTFADGSPLVGGVLEAAPIGDGPVARAAIDGKGQFALQTAGRPGARPGRYRVVVLPALVPGHPRHTESPDARFGRYESAELELHVPVAGTAALRIEVASASGKKPQGPAAIR